MPEERATAESWEHLEAPAEREDLRFEGSFTAEEMDLLRFGVIPVAMEDKWFIYFEEDWLRFHRSWTGAFIYALRFENGPDGAHVVESWVSRDEEQYGASDVA